MAKENKNIVKKNRVRLNVQIEKDLRDKFISIARENNTDASKLVRDFVYKYVKNEEGKNDNRRD